MRRLARLLLAARVGIACSATEPDGACDAAPPTEVLPTGWYEVAIRVSIDGHDRLFFAREDTISAAAAGFCDAHAAASGDCPSVLAARAAAVLQRCPVLVMLSDDDHSLACRWVRAPQPPARPAPAGDGSLAAWFNAYGAAAAGPLVVKYRHYFDVYERHLSRFRGRRFKLLEVGIAYGGSVRMWRAWLGEAFEHHCLDVDPATVARVERDAHGNGDRRRRRAAGDVRVHGLRAADHHLERVRVHAHLHARTEAGEVVLPLEGALVLEVRLARARGEGRAAHDVHRRERGGGAQTSRKKYIRSAERCAQRVYTTFVLSVVVFVSLYHI